MSQLTLYTNPQSRGRTAQWMLEEIGAPYESKVMGFEKDGTKSPEFRAINPMGQLPTLKHGDTVITEGAAICMYLADEFPKAHLAPVIGDISRASYLRWFFFFASSVEAATMDHMFPRKEPARETAIGYGNPKDLWATVENIFAKGPYALGAKFSALDVYITTMLWFAMLTKIPGIGPNAAAYVKRMEERPAYKRMLEICEKQMVKK